MELQKDDQGDNIFVTAYDCQNMTMEHIVPHDLDLAVMFLIVLSWLSYIVFCSSRSIWE